MPGATSALYHPLIERDLAAIPGAVRAFRASHSSDELFLAVARFAVLAYAPSQHAKHAMLACLSAYELREELGERFDELLVECATYIASSRQPWSEPPILEPPEPLSHPHIDALRECVRDGDRLRAERWLAARLDDAFSDLYEVATDDFEDLGHKLIVTHGAIKLSNILGEKGRFAALRMATWELTSYRGEAPAQRGADDATLDGLLERAIAEQGSFEAAHGVFLFDAAKEAGVLHRLPVSECGGRAAAFDSGGSAAALLSYPLARDCGQTLKAHAVAKRIQHPRMSAFLAAVHHNLAHGESLEDFSFA